MLPNCRSNSLPFAFVGIGLVQEATQHSRNACGSTCQGAFAERCPCDDAPKSLLRGAREQRAARGGGVGLDLVGLGGQTALAAAIWALDSRAGAFENRDGRNSGEIGVLLEISVFLFLMYEGVPLPPPMFFSPYQKH